MASLPPAFEAQFRKHVRRADAYLAAGQREPAIECLVAASELNPDNVQTRLRIAELHLAAGRHNPAREQVLRALSGYIGSPRAALALVRRLAVVGESAAVLAMAEQLPPPMWDSAATLAEMAGQLALVGAHEQADRFAHAAVERDAGDPAALAALAKSDLHFGRFDAAEQHAERGLARNPDDHGLQWLLSRMRRPGASQRIERLRATLARIAEPGARATLGYALHNELHDTGDYDAAWDALQAACAAKREKVPYDRAATAELFDALLGWSADEARIDDGHRDAAFRPIFIVGLHRSGTTLVERLISGHSQVTAGGETYDITAALRRASGFHCPTESHPRLIAPRAGYDYARIGREYLAAVRWRARGAPVLTDKLPSNYLNLGFIARALPEARILHLRRDPLDVGLSSLRTLFTLACPYSYDQHDYIDYHRHYERLMAHWHALFPGRIMDVDYAELVAEPEAVTRRMATFCGLQFEPAMVSIEQRRDAVSTASSVMMRDGIRTDRGRLWKAYERHLQPMIDAFSR